MSVRYTVKVKVNATLEQATKAWGSRGIALLFLYPRPWMGWMVNPHPGRFTSGKDLVPISQEAGWSQGLVWTGAENFASTGIGLPERPACSESL